MIRLIFLSLAILSLAGCSVMERDGLIHNRSQDYKNAQQTPAVVAPTGTTLASNEQNMYAIPNEAHDNNYQDNVSTLPPNVQTALIKKTEVKTKKLANVDMLTPPKESQLLTIAKPEKVVWQSADKLLTKAGYKVISKKLDLGIYFILDTAKTGGKIVLKTPIYQVHIKASNKDSTKVWVVNNNGQVLTKADAKKVLAALKSSTSSIG